MTVEDIERGLQNVPDKKIYPLWKWSIPTVSDAVSAGRELTAMKVAEPSILKYTQRTLKLRNESLWDSTTSNVQKIYALLYSPNSSPKAVTKTSPSSVVHVSRAASYVATSSNSTSIMSEPSL